MKSITIKQPWASLIIEGIKDIENRSWRCPQKYIGERVLIHAAATPWGNLKFDSCLSHILTSEQYSKLLQIGLDGFGSGKEAICWLDLYPHGSIIGSVEIADCVINHSSIWAERSYFNITSNPLPFNEEDEPDYIIYNWVLANPVKFDNPIPCKGKLSFWESRIEVCHICGQPCDADNICERCGENYCEKHIVHYNQFTQIDYNYYSKCVDRE